MTFKLTNNEEFGEYITEYKAGYRTMTTLQFYNTTPGEYILGMRAGLPRDEDLMRWVWDANRNHPVQENATLSFGRDGNLVLDDVDALMELLRGKPTPPIKASPGSNCLVPETSYCMYNKQGKFVWQSFDHPVDTLLAGMSLGVNGSAAVKLFSRTSDENGRDGKYSFVVNDKGFRLYLNSSWKSILFNGWVGSNPDPLVGVQFITKPIFSRMGASVGVLPTSIPLT